MSGAATALARDVLQALLAQGVTDLVLAPGSRNAPVAFAAADAAAAGLLRLHTRIDERSAAFLALGLTRAGGRAVVTCTSGTAVANLHPALLEAVHAGVPMIALTADRPRRLAGTSANQTTEQVDVFGPLLTTVDLEAGPVPDLPLDRPAHVNLRLDDPLTPDDRWTPAAVPAVDGWRAVRGRAPGGTLPRGPRTVVVAGDDAGPPARRLAEAGGWPLLAEPSSGSRTGEAALRCYRLLLGADDLGLAADVERVVVAGHPTLSRPVQRLLARADVEVLDLEPPGRFARPHPVARHVPGARVDGEPDSAELAWRRRWAEADAALGRALDLLLAAEPALTPYEVAGAVVRATEPGALLVVGPSNPIRDLDLMQRGFGVGERRMVLANRGLAGIDGVVSTAIGAALARPHSTRAIALLGDVTFLHDANGLLLGPDEPRPDLTLVVVNDDGGSIFATLEQGGPAYADRFERLFATPHHADLASLCAASRTPHVRVDSLPELEQVLASPNGGLEVVEARVGRGDRRALDERIRALRP
ncbi:2-succinyl-5-enolpyruvyl-6-hydroxy-3-cyclohexene-1-carboxylic-acid synthase [Nocardioides sp. TRM66260-LWL]|uniref:2-succinyl-5-enolpyruvyl-6-hydroxy-3- cyclohexene-1-carboxylic-acid synthase n=1 Tax=Nocardioides sp. TRM66260-LWL TaxID=2874478 RepID=UPI001CC67F4D|nr:2-succinyl-5-enolpyruvyl-6-hydroxy-3-cyclohexene-1-carboxylic-acid synthase [Nocardioides sp. TRM66260-LWL]MBZ5734810.1 2-succinyl-5-enolpyruvyl-6-hydroxy-3-cyclohexene-1-carboxylic-acid synthase [Nocardioides sp. TRM66260-LWL]